MILVLSGLPASGKTTYALEWLAEDPSHRARVSYDELRLEMFGPDWVFNRKQESLMKDQALLRATTALNEDKDVIVDNTNLTTSARAPWEALAKEMDVPYKQHEISTPVHVCVERDRQRKGKARVGRAVIERMALFTGWIDWNDTNVYEPRQQFVVVDIDGTLSDPSRRLHHIRNPNKCDCGAASKELCVEQGCKAQGFKPRWDLFHAEVDQDKPIPAIMNLVEKLSSFYHVIIVSGRSPEHGCGLKTEDWLDKHLNYGNLQSNYLHLFMRASDDYKPDYEHKQEILDLLPKDRIAFVLDDRLSVLRMWQANGLTTLAVGDLKEF